MKGIIFNLVEDAVTSEHGDSVWDCALLGPAQRYPRYGADHCVSTARFTQG